MTTGGAGSIGRTKRNSKTTTSKILIAFIVLSVALTGIVSAIPPNQVTALANASSCKDVVWTWTNPALTDFNGTTIWRNGVFVTNLSNTTATTTWTGLTTGGIYTINISTYNITGYRNLTNATQTTVLPACPNPVTCTSTGILGGLSLAGIMLIGLGAVMIIVPFQGTGALGRGGVSGGEMRGLPGWTTMGVITICLGGILLLISYIILSPIFTLAGC